MKPIDCIKGLHETDFHTFSTLERGIVQNSFASAVKQVPLSYKLAHNMYINTEKHVLQGIYMSRTLLQSHPHLNLNLCLWMLPCQPHKSLHSLAAFWHFNSRRRTTPRYQLVSQSVGFNVGQSANQLVSQLVHQLVWRVLVGFSIAIHWFLYAHASPESRTYWTSLISRFWCAYETAAAWEVALVWRGRKIKAIKPTANVKVKAKPWAHNTLGQLVQMFCSVSCLHQINTD